ncbi:unnamed protein product [Linum trigynum]|uniref:Uncharacterized protein n=1 Tax=Linum trigynum TaxID=586398 RepID=A0AAV2DA06_9ROSI
MLVKPHLNLGLVILKTLYKNITNVTVKTIHGGAFITHLARYFGKNLEDCNCTIICHSSILRGSLIQDETSRGAKGRKTIKGIAAQPLRRPFEESQSASFVGTGKSSSGTQALQIATLIEHNAKLIE